MAWLILAETGTGAAVAAPLLLAQSSAAVTSIWDFVVKGGPVMIPLGICSLVAVAIIVERLISLRRTRIIPPDFVAGVRGVLRAGRNVDAALEYCRTHPSPIANVFSAGIRRLGESIELLERHIQEAGEREILRLRKHLRLLSLITSISTLLGLLGTIFGMITAFQTVATSGEALGRTELLARGIYEALITTAAGLIVAIPAMIAYHGIAAKIERLVMEIDERTVEFVEEFVLARPALPGQAGSQNGPVAAPPVVVSAQSEAAGGSEVSAVAPSVASPAPTASTPVLSGG